MATATYDLISSTTISSGVASVTFSSIAASWTDLKLIAVATVASGTADTILQINGDTGTNYSQTAVYGSGSSAGSYNLTSRNWFYGNQAANSTTIPVFDNYDIFSYAGSTYKTVLTTISQDKNGSGFALKSVGLWLNTAAITSLTYTTASGNLGLGTVVSLYGIKAA
jgi:hypothetical protein